MSGSDDGSRRGDDDAVDSRRADPGSDGPGEGDAPPEFDPTDGRDVEPVGAMIAVAFTGAAIGLVGAGIAPFASDLGLALIGVGVVVALSSPFAYLRIRRRYGA